MGGFVSVESSRGAGVVARAGACGWVWASRAMPGGPGWHPAPACLFVPFASFSQAGLFAQAVGRAGWRVWLRSGSAVSAVWSACGLSAPVFAVKVALPAGLSAGTARRQLAALLPGAA